MANLFQATEIVNIGIEDEVSGAALYQALAAKTATAALKAFYEAMVAKERVHEQQFRDLLAGVEGHTIHESYPGEYEAYLRALLDARAFPTAAVAVEKANAAPDDRAGLDLALQMEKDTLTLFLEIVELIPERHRPVVQAIIDEERSHLVAISGQLRELG
jgi:rubrerythrin